MSFISKARQPANGAVQEVVMRAQFHLAADMDVDIESDATGRYVVVTMFEGVDYGPDSPDTTKRSVAQWNLGKNEARAIASAMMGCAAQL